jgi:uncharacterized protein
MAIVQQMRTQLREAMKARDAVRTKFLRYWIAQLTLGTGAEVPDDQAVKKMRGILKEAQAGRTAFSPEEQALIQEWVPPALNREEIRAALTQVADQIRAAPKEGQAMGIAMKHLAGQPTDADEVRAVLAEMRG